MLSFGALYDVPYSISIWQIQFLVLHLPLNWNCSISINVAFSPSNESVQINNFHKHKYDFIFFFDRRVLKNREVEIIVPKPYLNHPLNVIEQKKKDSIHSIENAIGMYFYLYPVKIVSGNLHMHIRVLKGPQINSATFKLWIDLKTNEVVRDLSTCNIQM